VSFVNCFGQRAADTDAVKAATPGPARITEKGEPQKRVTDLVTSVTDGKPPVNRRVIVVCKQCRCLGYLDRAGIWRDARNDELKDVVGWFEI